nr:hypothetical protein [Methylomarinum sp. Ch1-1]MDP4522423.1 hypothetical protein [Methylomarinum sp. Ch1-1]
MGPSDGCDITRRVASRSKPPQPAPGAKFGIVCIKGGLPGGESTHIREAHHAQWIRSQGNYRNMARLTWLGRNPT